MLDIFITRSSVSFTLFVDEILTKDLLRRWVESIGGKDDVDDVDDVDDDPCNSSIRYPKATEHADG